MSYPQDPSQYPDPNSGYYQQPSPQQPDPAQYPPTTGFQAPVPTGTTGRNFFASLFDFSFRTYVTPQVIQIYYGVALVLLALGMLFGLVSAILTIASDYVLLGLFQLILVPIFGFVYLLVIRMLLELISNFFHMGDDLRALRQKSDHTP